MRRGQNWREPASTNARLAFSMLRWATKSIEKYQQWSSLKSNINLDNKILANLNFLTFV
jgi:hypothetical protein